MSGVSRLKAARSGGGSNPVEHGPQKTEAYGGAKGKSPDLKVPTKTRPFRHYPETPVPLASEYSRTSKGPAKVS